ncbi:hypothetical protein CDL12_02418 [Handroanthus impetiginosus]|uniref:NAB domain-containing protein n=1 Tax=Handroanthus impetiginosus TaxID=429701 RepID=A0A2G9I4Z7_9LAMI|nr:hypothetical protein CDL12_02418 [Handroanthus impetiginosus]
MVAKTDKTCGGELVVVPSNHQSRRRRSFNKPSWLLCAIAANSYYHERPQLLALLDDLYNGYLSLADRYCQVLAKNNRNSSRCSSPIPLLKFDEDAGEVIDSDAESSVSFQLSTVLPLQTKEMDADMVVADLVMKTVEYDIVLNELTVVEKRWAELKRKMELQKNLLDVLESERLILLNDNATLGYRVTALVEENKGLLSESLFLKRKAAELARCMLKTREDHRVCMLSGKIEDLQGQIHGLEKRNKEYYEQLVKQEEETNKFAGRKSKGGEVNLEECFQESGGGRLRKCFSFNVKKVGDQNGNGGGIESTRVSSKLWDKVKKFDLFLCGPHFNSGGC